MIFRPLEIAVSAEQVGITLGSFYFEDGSFSSFFGVVWDGTVKTVYVPIFFKDIFLDYGEDYDDREEDR